MAKITALIITKNEEKNIAKAIKTVDWCDEILVVDTGSTDKTVGEAKKSGAKVISLGSSKPDYAAWRNKGAKKGRGDWLLYVDADEEVSKALKSEIKGELKTTQFAAFDIPRKNYILGKWMRHGGQWPDKVLRLIRKDSLVGWKGVLHEQPKIKGKLGHLANPLIHHKHDNLEDMVTKTNMWSEVEAKLMFDAGHPPMNVFRFTTAALREFWKRMIVQMAFLDGPKGIIYALYQVFSRFVSYAKLWEMQNASSTI